MSACPAGYGHDRYAYIAGQRVLVGLTRTLRPAAGEPSTAFLRRVDALVQTFVRLAPEGTLTLDEELRDGVLVQVCLQLHMAPAPAAPPEDTPPSRRRQTMEAP